MLNIRKYRCRVCGSTDTAVYRSASETRYSCNACGSEYLRRRIKKCPSCGSTSIYYEAGLITGQKYHCNECDYVGSLIFEQEIEELLKGKE